MKKMDIAERKRLIKETRKELAETRLECDILKLARMQCGDDVPSKYRFIKAHTRQFPVKAMCGALDIARSGYYKWLGKNE